MQKKHFIPNKCPYFQGSFCSAISSFFRALLQADHPNQAIKASGLANAWAKMVVSAGHYLAMGHPIGVLMALSFITSLLANLMSHTATAALMAPIAMKVCAAESMKLVLFGQNFSYEKWCWSSSGWKSLNMPVSANQEAEDSCHCSDVLCQRFLCNSLCYISKYHDQGYLGKQPWTQHLWDDNGMTTETNFK